MFSSRNRKIPSKFRSDCILNKIFLLFQAELRTEFPENICTECKQSLIDAFLFRQKCQNALSELMKLVQIEDDIKIEANKAENFQQTKRKASRKVIHCPDLSDYFPNEILLEEFQRIAHENNADLTGNAVSEKQKYICDICNKVSSKLSNLRRHMMIHSDERPHACDICDKRFRRADKLRFHQNSHANIKPYECKICWRRFTRPGHLHQHNTTQHQQKKEKVPKYECDLCELKFSTKKTFLKHKKAHPVENESKKNACSFCGVSFASSNELKSHKECHENEKQFLCSECGVRFLRSDYLKFHMRRHKGDNPYQCKYCPKKFPRSTDVKAHERYHRGERNHLCKVCGKKFHRAYTLSVHMRVHTGERPYQCTYCPKSFTQRNDLNAHIRRHTGERFKCDLCNCDGFILRYHLTQHKRKVHGIAEPANNSRLTKVQPAEMVDDGMTTIDHQEYININDDILFAAITES